MRSSRNRNKKKKYFSVYLYSGGVLVIVVIILILNFGNFFTQEYHQADATSIKNAQVTTDIQKTEVIPVAPQQIALTPIDPKIYDQKMVSLANYSANTPTTTVRLWPVNGPYPTAGALLPFNRIIAYYGNLYSKQMGVLGQYPKDEMLSRLNTEVVKWQHADPNTPVIPALDYIAVTAQGSAGSDGMYRARMPFDQVDQIMDTANQIHGIVFLDIQVGLSNVQTEVPLLEKYLKLPNVHLALDPEFSMKTGAKPGTVIGTMDATDINFASNYLANLVKQYNLPPKILVIHRFTQPMVTNDKNIKLVPQVQVVMDMDGWGPQAKKIGTYNAFIASRPVQFTGFKLFYKNDIRNASTTLLTPQQILKLTPQPSYIQFQ